MNIDDVLHRVRTEEVVLCDSGWFMNPSTEEIENAYAEFGHRYEEAKRELVARIGDPDLTNESHPADAKELYHEALRLTGWKRQEGLLVLALVHHDRETPVIVSLEYKEEDEA